MQFAWFESVIDYGVMRHVYTQNTEGAHPNLGWWHVNVNAIFITSTIRLYYRLCGIKLTKPYSNGAWLLSIEL